MFASIPFVESVACTTADANANGSAAAAVAGVILLALLLPTTAMASQRVTAAPALSVTAAATDAAGHAALAQGCPNNATALRSQSPWPAPVGHRQPRRHDVPPSEASSAKSHGQLLDLELDRKLMICRC
jgi:hypothetical protein